MTTNASVPGRQDSLLRSAVKRLRGQSDGLASQQAQDIAYIAQSGLFDSDGYLRRYPDVAEAGIDPLEHYVAHGASEGRVPCEMFDTAYYLENNPDVASSGLNPFRHFCEFGWKEQRNPSPGFNMALYAATEMGAEAAQMNPLVHLLARDTPYKPADAVPRAQAGRRDDYQIIKECGIFDAEFYLESYPEVAAAGMDPVRHYIDHGAKERRNPSPFFNTGYYIENNVDIARAGMNPLTHFCEYGWRELRAPSEAFDIVRYWLMHMARKHESGNPLVHYLAKGRVEGLLSYRMEEQGPLERNRMVAVVEGMLTDEQLEISTLGMLGKAMSTIGRWSTAEQAFRQLAMREWNKPAHHVALARALAAQGKWWLVVESLMTALGFDANQPSWLFMLGDANERMNRFAAAADAFQRAVVLSPGHADWYYRLGYASERAGIGSADAYEEALRLTTDKDAQRYGVGVFHQARGFWEGAKEAYAAEALRKPLDGGLRYRLGMAHDRLYRWQDAADCFMAAIALTSGTRMPSWHYRLGFVLERMQRWNDAADAYAAAVMLSDRHIAYWNYRLAYVLEKAGRLEDASVAWRNTREKQQLAPYEGFLLPEAKALRATDDALPSLADHARYFAKFSGASWIEEALRQDATIAESHYRLGESLERAGDLQSAARAYSAALARSSEHNPAWFYRLGYVLSESGRFQEACDAFRQTRILQRPDGVSEDAFWKNPDQLVTTSYVEYYECLPVREDVILYESFNGNSLTCSPLALFRALLQHPVYGGHLHVWVLNDPSRIPEEFKHLQNVVFVSKGSDGYLRYLATAKYLINNSGFPPYFIRRPEQKYLATWHGTPLKTLGKEQKYKFYDHKRTQRNFLQATHIITPNPHTTQVTLDSYDIRPLYTGLVAETGYPRVDLMLNASEERRQWLRTRLGVSTGKPVVLYAPTWRGTLDEVQFDSARLEHDLEALARQDCQVLFRGHSLLERVIKNDHVQCQVVPADIDTNELLSVVDVLITDYSSIFFDFMASGRPILYYIYDVEEYEQERGLYFSMDEMPGFKCRTIESLCEALGQAISTGMPDEGHYVDAQKAYGCHDDGRATERTIDFFFDDSRESTLEYNVVDRPAIIMAGGSFTPNGITTSFINLVSNIDRGRYDVIVALAPTTMELLPDNVAQFRKLPEDIFAVPRYGNVPMSMEERWLKKRHDTGSATLDDEAMAIIRRIYDREFIRIFGPKQFHAAISFAGYDAFWTALLVANNFSFRKVVYLHNDMYSEYTTRFPDLSRMFQLYGMADKLVSVSDKTHALNRSNLATRYGLDDIKFDFCDNLSNPEEIIARSAEKLEDPADEALFTGGGPVFVNLARLSIEKDHEKLIRAFAFFVKDHPDGKLLILGSGPLLHQLSQLVDQLDLRRSVHLLGYRANPYPYLGRADCFILSSNHEGQPMTLLEALVLRKPIVATDITGNRSVLHDRPGLLVPNSIDGLVQGMSDFVDGSIPAGIFDWHAYQENAINLFYGRVLGVPSAISGRAQ